MAEKIPAEDDLIAYLRRRIESRPTGVLRVGIGDDAAVLSPGQREWVLTCDQFLEGVHFVSNIHSADSVGYKALARATSDIAAMGARPQLFLLSLALPAALTGKWFRQMASGMASASRRFGLTLAGGDMARSPVGVALSITVLGDIRKGYAVRRDGARPGDAIFVAGQLGAAQAGLELVLRGLAHRNRNDPTLRRLLAAHNYPEPCIALGQWLAKRRLASAMMDISDGLSTDLLHLCKSSAAGAVIKEADLPAVVLPRALAASSARAGRRATRWDARALALHGGEDYGLLFTTRPKLVPKIPAAFEGVPITRIGQIVRGQGVTLIARDGGRSRLLPQGWDHFRRSQ
jgi:thiamine-monophosphate kinase